ncbi:ABC transporter ATP-binding protein [Lentzea sp. E54]|uniref:ABC transporter ATP-binding protein n=1 Tax=Lentzea xerophila TaxID=3435883 RepID=UPI003DA61C32
MIEVVELSKRYGDKQAVDTLSFTVRQGSITGFLGPNGAGKSTTMRAIVGLDRPTSGHIRIDGKPANQLTCPPRHVGALLDAKSVHTGRSARDHLRALAAISGVSNRRVDEMIELVGLGKVARKRAGGFSLGMGQRLGIASALLADPGTLLLDEPVNGLDPDGVLWLRNLLKSLAAQGRAVLISSHLMSEVAVTADHLVVIGKGKLVADAPIDEFISSASRRSAIVRSPHLDVLRRVLVGDGVVVTDEDAETVRVDGLSTAEIGDRALAAGAAVHELTPVRASLEEAYMRASKDNNEYVGATAVQSPGEES